MKRWILPGGEAGVGRNGSSRPGVGCVEERGERMVCACGSLLRRLARGRGGGGRKEGGERQGEKETKGFGLLDNKKSPVQAAPSCRDGRRETGWERGSLGAEAACTDHVVTDH